MKTGIGKSKIPLKDKIANIMIENGNKILTISEIAKYFPTTPESTIRGRLNEGVKSDNPIFERVYEGAYILKGLKSTIGLLEGNARKPSNYFDKESLDLIISDFPRDDSKAHKGGNKDFTSDYDCFTYENFDFQEKFLVLKDDTFLIEFIPERSATNERMLNNLSSLAKNTNRFEYFKEILNYITINDPKFSETYKNTLINKANYGEIDLIEKVEELKLIYNEKIFENPEFKKLEKTFKKSDGFDFYVDIPIIGGNLNTGRKSSFISVVRIFKKGNPKLRIFDEKLGRDIEGGKFDFMKDKFRIDFKKVYSYVLEPDKEKLLNEFDKQINIGEIPNFKTIKKMLSSLDSNEISNEERNLKIKTINEFKLAFVEYIDWLSDIENNYKLGNKTLFPEVYEAEKILKEDKIHQAQKPLNVYIDLLKQTSNVGAIVVELFAGSFRSGEAQIQLEKKGFGPRTIIGIEKDREKVIDTTNYFKSKYVDIEFINIEEFKKEMNNFQTITNEENEKISNTNYFINKMNIELNQIINISFNIDEWNIDKTIYKGDINDFNLKNYKGNNLINGKPYIFKMEMKRNSDDNRFFYLVPNYEKNKFELCKSNGEILNKNIEEGITIDNYLFDAYKALSDKIING